MYNFLDGEIAKLGLRRKFVRRELFGTIEDSWNQHGYPADARGKSFNLRILQYGQEFETKASADESLLVAVECAGIAAPSRCRSGECGWCRSRLVWARSALQRGVRLMPCRNIRERALLRQGYSRRGKNETTLNELVCQVELGVVSRQTKKPDHIGNMLNLNK